MSSNQYSPVGKFFVLLCQFFDQLKPGTPTVSVLLRWRVLLLGSWLLATVTTASAEERLPAARIFDELPPPSTSSPTRFGFPAAPLSPVSPNPSPGGREFNFQAPNQPSLPQAPTPPADLYRVDILGDSPLLLSQVRQMEPKAFVRPGEGVIQAGVFSDQLNAQSRVRVLAEQGVPAQVRRIAVGVGGAGVDAGQVLSDRAYFVIIPGNPKDLPRMANQVVRLGVRREVVSQRDAPRGPHVAVGPFDSRPEADRWNSYFRSVGMDARVYFGN